MYITCSHITETLYSLCFVFSKSAIPNMGYGNIDDKPTPQLWRETIISMWYKCGFTHYIQLYTCSKCLKLALSFTCGVVGLMGWYFDRGVYKLQSGNVTFSLLQHPPLLGAGVRMPEMLPGCPKPRWLTPQTPSRMTKMLLIQVRSPPAGAVVSDIKDKSTHTWLITRNSYKVLYLV